MKRLYFLFLLSPLLPLLNLLRKNDSAFLMRDIAICYLAAKKFWVESILAFHAVPSWDPLSYGGTPYRADLNSSPLHPLNFLFLLFPREIYKGYLLFVGIHLLLLVVGSFLLFRRLHFGERGALAASLVLGLSGISFSTMNMMNVAASFAAFPFFFYFLLNLQKKFSWWPFVGAAVAGAWPVYSGDPQFSYWMALLSAPLIGARCARERSIFPLLRTAGGALLAFGISAAQLLPALKLASASERGLDALTLVHAERFSLHPLRFFEFFLPFPFGNVGYGQAWIGRLTDGLFNIPFLLHIYLGLAITGFTAWRLARLPRRRPSRKNLLFLFGLVFLFSLALGRYAPVDLYGFFFSWIPGWNFFRYPERLLFIFVFLLLVWIGPMFRWVPWRLGKGAKSSPKFLFAAVIIILAAFLCFGAYGTIRILEIHTLSAALMHACLLSSLFLLFIYFRGKISWVRKYSFLIFCGLLVLDALPFGFLLLWETKAEEVPYKTNVFAEKIHRHIAGRPEQIKVGAADRYFHGTYRGPYPTSSTNPLQIGQAWDWGVMYPNITMYFGIANPGGYSPFDPKEILDLWERHGSSDPARLLNLFSVAYFPVAEGDRPALKYSANALPHAWFPAAVSFYSNAKAAEAALFDPKFPYLTSAIFGGKMGAWKQGGGNWVVQNYSRTPDHVLIEVLPRSGEGYFVWNERFHPSWKAFYRGKEIPVAVANTWAMGVKLEAEAEAGVQVLEFIYQDKAERAGNWITVASLFFILFASGGRRILYSRRSRG